MERERLLKKRGQSSSYGRKSGQFAGYKRGFADNGNANKSFVKKRFEINKP